MPLPLSNAGPADPQDLPQHLVPKFQKYFFTIITVAGFLAALENMILGTRWQPSIPSWLTDLKDFARMVSDDLAAVTLPGQSLVTLRRFWSSVLAIADEYHNQGRVLETLVAMLQKIHSTARSLRRFLPTEDDIIEVAKLSQIIVRLLSRVLPKPFLVISRRSPDPDKLIHLPEVQENLQKLTEQVNLLHRNAYNRQVTPMGCPRAHP
ncbi:hypothetical protein DL96DRAFT_1712674 [Flagelloscypha sp. PMI_526]|nr:hypothetical protein DL96DRAFT_1712674 [Flagelloscypha sp. PMI_526]